jgi:hypothetical protein
MKLYPTIQTKQTTKLFNNKYKYKIVLVSKAAGWFRGCNFEGVTEGLLLQNDPDANKWLIKLTPDEQLYTLWLKETLEKLSNYEIRVENPFISFYTNTKEDVEKLAKLDSDRVKYVSLPKAGTESVLDNHKVIVKNLDFDYKVTMGRTIQNFTEFVAWCEDKDKIRMPKRAKRDLSKNACWGGSHFYVKDEKMLLMVKMFVGGYIHSVESVVKE